MSRHRFYCKTITESIVELAGDEAHHAASVCRLKEGEKVELFDGVGCLAEAVVTDIKRRRVTLEVGQIKIYDAARQKIIIAASIAKGERFDWLISKCSEMGVDRICPIIFHRTVKQSKNPKAIERWQRIAVEAAKQCRRLFLPRLDEPLVIEDALDALKRDYPKARIMFGSLDKEATGVDADVISGVDVIAIVGPEGGYTEEEAALLRSKGAYPVRLSDTVLRVETAALAFAAVLAAKRCAQFTVKDV